MPVTIEAGPVMRRLEGMWKKLDTFPREMDKEFLEWQREDMRRQTPQTTAEPHGSSTIITPRGERQPSHKKKPSVAPQRRRVLVRKGGKRPILRVELYDKLVQRMDKLMSTYLVW